MTHRHRLPALSPLAVILLILARAPAAAAHTDTVAPSAFTPERAAASIAVLVGLAGVVLGRQALTRPAAAGARRSGSLALLAGLTSLVVGGLVVATAKGGFGTGHGLAGGILALLAGTTSVVMVGLARTRSRGAAD